jgi:hypothetical protein
MSTPALGTLDELPKLHRDTLSKANLVPLWPQVITPLDLASFAAASSVPRINNSTRSSLPIIRIAPISHDCGSNVIFRRRVGVAQRAALAIKFVKNVITICADPIAVEASNRQGSSIRKGESLCGIVNYKAQVIFAPRRRFPGRRTNDDDLRRRAMQIGARQHGPCHNNDHDCDHSTSGQQPVREEAHGKSSGGTARLCHKISPPAFPLAEAGNQSPSVAQPSPGTPLNVPKFVT